MAVAVNDSYGGVWGIRIQTTVCILLFGLIVLGAGVRLADAGLSCPDWPLCFGQAVPTLNFKIFMEWIHRVIAGTVGLLALTSATLIFSKIYLRSCLGLLSLCSLLLFFTQAWLGGQTVIQLLRAEIVTSHLVGGYLLLAINLWILSRWKKSVSDLSAYENRKFSKAKISSATETLFASLMILVSFFQAVLGALVSSHYAGHACPDFPLCQGSFIPQPFVAEVALHVIHRAGAVILLLAGFYFAWKMRHSKMTGALARLALVFILAQWALGISMIFTRIHPGASLLHSLGSLSIFTTYLWLNLQRNSGPQNKSLSIPSEPPEGDKALIA